MSYVHVIKVGYPDGGNEPRKDVANNSNCYSIRNVQESPTSNGSQYSSMHMSEKRFSETTTTKKTTVTTDDYPPTRTIVRTDDYPSTHAISPSYQPNTSIQQSSSSYEHRIERDYPVKTTYRTEIQSNPSMMISVGRPAQIIDQSTSNQHYSVKGDLVPRSITPPQDYNAPQYYRPSHASHREPVANKCYRCLSTVYHIEKVGPIKECLYHKQCFRCIVCGTFLSLKNFYHNLEDVDDREIYCRSHQPNADSSKGSNLDAVSVRAAMTVPVLNLEAANKMNVQDSAWTKRERRGHAMPPGDIRRDY